jgi:hypothetical protein
VRLGCATGLCNEVVQRGLVHLMRSEDLVRVKEREGENIGRQGRQLKRKEKKEMAKATLHRYLGPEGCPACLLSFFLSSFSFYFAPDQRPPCAALRPPTPIPPPSQPAGVPEKSRPSRGRRVLHAALLWLWLGYCRIYQPPRPGPDIIDLIDNGRGTRQR